MAKRVPHDRLFKELLGTFLFEFLELFLPELAVKIELDSLVLMGETEVFPPGERSRRADLVARARLRGASQETFFLVHVEHEANNKDPLGFPRRMLQYALYLHDTTGLEVYPIALVSYAAPKRPLSDRFELFGPDGHQIFCFHYRLIQLNRLSWRDYTRNPNPVAAALMSRMGIPSGERPLVKLACLRLLRKLNLETDPSFLIASFVDIYLQLDKMEEEQFRGEFSKVSPKEQEEMLKLTNSWHEAGRKEGREEGREEERKRAELAEQKRQLAEQERQQAEQKLEQERQRAEILAQRLRDLGEDPDAL